MATRTESRGTKGFCLSREVIHVRWYPMFMISICAMLVGTLLLSTVAVRAYAGEKGEADLSNAAVSPIDDQDWTGSEIEPSVTVTCDGAVLQEGEDYVLSYEDNVEVGLATVTISGTGSFSGNTTQNFRIQIAENGATPIAGENRYETAATIACSAYPNGSAGVIVVTGSDFPDALSASALAGMIDWPIVLTESSSLSKSTVDAIKELGARKAIIIGGTGAVSDNVKGQLEKIVVGGVERIGGSNRYETAEKVYVQGTKKGSWYKTAIVATGKNYPDAVSISGYAFAKKAPIFLCNPVTGLTSNTLNILASGGFNRIIILGEKQTVSAEVENLIKQKVPKGVSVLRKGGSDRYETSRLIAEFAISDGCTANGACVATGKNFPDALAGSALAGKNKAVVLLADDGKTGALAVLNKNRNSVQRICYLGGKGAVSAAVRSEALKQANL